MRFRANVENVSAFLHIIQAVEKLQKKCIIKFTETDMHIICNADTEDSVQVWSQIKIDSIFTEYRIQSNAGNTIHLELAPDALMQVLKSAVTSPEIDMKLAKKNGQAVLSFDITTTSSTHKRVQLTHDVLINVLRPTDMAKIREPRVPDPDVHIFLPPLPLLRTVTDHLRQLSAIAAISANRRGDLTLSVHTDTVKVDVRWTGCEVAKMDEDEPNEEPPEQEPDPAQMYSVLVPVRSIAKFLSSHVVSTKTIACICHNHCIILYVYIGEVADAGGVLTFWIPSRLSGEDG